MSCKTHLFCQLNWQQTSTCLKTYGGSSLFTLGECFLTVKFNDKMVNALFVRAAVPNDSVPLLSFTSSKELEIFENHKINQVLSVNKVVNAYTDVFGNL